MNNKGSYDLHLTNVKMVMRFAIYKTKNEVSHSL